MTLDFISLFAGIGGIDLGLERAGMRCVAQVENDLWCQAVLMKHWPDVPKFGDVRDVGAHNLPRADLICGGFPCQDLSYAGRGAGLAGARSGLWFEYARIIRELRPRYVLVENVPGLLARGLGTVIGDLAACGYDAEWDCIPAAAVGAPHRRDRVWIVAYPNGGRRIHGQAQEFAAEGRLYALREPVASGPNVADSHGSERWTGTEGWDVPDRDDAGREEAAGGPSAQREDGRLRQVDDANGNEQHGRAIHVEMGRRGGASETAAGGRLGSGDQWRAEPNVGRVANGVPARVDRLRGLGNAVVPQVVEWIGRRIVEAEAREEVA